MVNLNTLTPMNIQEYERYTPSAFDEGMTILEKINKLIYSYNDVVNKTNANTESVGSSIDGFSTTLATLEKSLSDLDAYAKGSLLKTEVMTQLQTWLTDGNLSNLFNEGLTRTIIPYRYEFGGQLKKLKTSLMNKLEQYTEIVFIGDSIVWGDTLPENATSTPRDGTLSDARDNFISPSFVNEFKRYIQRNYSGKTPVLSNWSTSPTGESTMTLTNDHILYPYNGDFTLTTSGTLTSVTEVDTPGSVSGKQLRLGVASTTVGGLHKIEFPFTGEKFTLSFGTTIDSMDYELYVDGVSQGVFTTKPGGSIVTGNDNRREHNFSYVKNKTIRIETRLNGYVGTNTLRIEAIIVPKTIKVINQGIIGITTDKYITYNMAGNGFGDGIAINDKSSYVIVQLGTNDRIIRTGVAVGTNAFKINLNRLLDMITTDVILMSANPAANEDPTVYSFNMGDVRSTIYEVADTRNIDMIDNYLLFDGFDTTDFTADGLHPNKSGHQMYAKNIINSLER